ncbi:deoxyribonuclease V [uncultured Chloroflexus sp.]|uniref:deoxyribonuclease V n=1 Tax=uncultured Chloroflexus sp. TaxID=214040 RepID=UPI0026341BEC|nr:deoxyribonuclease V [uncultured Chloroflexus sp.]
MPTIDDHDERIAAAIAEQQALRQRVVLRDAFGELRLVAGVDAGFEQDGAVIRAAVVVLRFPELTPVDYALVRQPVTFPYVPGLLAFREAPAIMTALDRLRMPPDLVICDGHGIAHPRRCGIACHIGVLLDLPTIGCAKQRLIGRFTPPVPERGACSSLSDGHEQIGWVLRTRADAQPVFVSPGHRVSLDRAPELVMACTTRFRLPETTRFAHRLASHGQLPLV